MNLTIKSKKADNTITSAGGAMGFISLMVGFIILYIIFLPPDERAKLLGENETIEDEDEEKKKKKVEEENSPFTQFKNQYLQVLKENKI